MEILKSNISVENKKKIANELKALRSERDKYHKNLNGRKGKEEGLYHKQKELAEKKRNLISEDTLGKHKKHNPHRLVGDRDGQWALDVLGENETTGVRRNAKRLIYERDADDNYVPSQYIEDHDYNKKPNKRQEKALRKSENRSLNTKYLDNGVELYSNFYNFNGETRTKTQRLKDAFEVESNVFTGSTKQQKKDVIKDNVKNQLKPKPRATAGGVLDMIDTIDREPDANAGTIDAYAGSYETRTGKGVIARAVVAEASAHAGPCSASAEALTATAGASYNASGVKAYANATLARAEASAGPLGVGTGLSLDTGASVGVDGVGASVAGFGFNIGPKMQIKTPIVDVECNIF